jgi:hypothetical protein
MQDDDLGAVTERINAGAEIARIEASLMEHIWNTLGPILKEHQQNMTHGLHAVAGDPELFPQDPEQRVALMMRYALLDALVERGMLDEYIENESLRKKMFAAAAQFPCDKNDLGEALAHRLAREAPPDVAQKTREEFRLAGYDPDHPKVAGKLIDWMHDHC